jgi:hypothetical protein
MRQIWITHVHFFAQKHSKDKRYEKITSKKTGLKSETSCSSVYCPNQRPCAHSCFYFFPQIHFFTNQPWAFSLNKPTIQNLVKANAA